MLATELRGSVVARSTWYDTVSVGYKYCAFRKTVLPLFSESKWRMGLNDPEHGLPSFETSGTQRHITRNIVLYSRTFNVPHGQPIDLLRRPGKKATKKLVFCPLQSTILLGTFSSSRCCGNANMPGETTPLVAEEKGAWWWVALCQLSSSVTSSSHRVQVNWAFLWEKLSRQSHHTGRKLNSRTGKICTDLGKQKVETMQANSINTH